MSPMVKPFTDDRLKDYVQVNERLIQFYAKYPEGSIQAEPVPEWSDESRICMVAYAYRTPDDPRPGKGYSWLEIPGKTPYTRGSEIENAETSAWGRALASLGFEVKRGVASRDEIESKGAGGGDGQPAPPPQPPEAPEPPESGEVTISGQAAAGRQAPVDLLLRQTPDGAVFGFVVVSEMTGKTQVIALGSLADDIWDAIAHDGVALQGKQVTVTGTLERVAWQKKGEDGQMRDMPPYRRLRLSRMSTEEWTLPAPVEAESLPLFEEAS